MLDNQTGFTKAEISKTIHIGIHFGRHLEVRKIVMNCHSFDTDSIDKKRLKEELIKKNASISNRLDFDL